MSYKKSFTLSFISIALGILFFHNTIAQPLTEQDFYAELPLVLSVSRLKQALIESPSSVTVIDREMIAASGFREIKDIFRLVPGFQVSNYSGNTAIVTYHGLSEQFSRRLQVLINGRPAYLPFFGGVAWSDIPYDIEDIERIEVIRGPNAAVYGSNSFSAVISITTRAAAGTQQSHIVTRRGNQGITDGYFSYTNTLAKGEYAINLSYAEDDGFADFKDEKQSTRLNAVYSSAISPVDNLIWEAGLLRGPRGMGRGASLIDKPRERDVEAQFLRIKWDHESILGDNFYIQYFHQTHDIQDIYTTRGELSLPIGTPPLSITLPVDIESDFSVGSERQEIEVQYSPQTTGNYRYVLGGSFRKDKVTAPFILDMPSRELEQTRLFTNIEYRINTQWLLNAGFMLENNELVDTIASPKLTAIYKIRDNHALRFTLSKATRTPVLIEKYTHLEFSLENLPSPFPSTVTSLEGLSSGNISEEAILSKEIGYHTYFNRNLSSFNLKLFKEDIDGLISQIFRPSHLSLDNSVYDFTNTDDITIQGLEAAFEHRFSGNTRIHTGYSYARIKSEDIGNEFSKSVPRHQFFIFMQHSLSYRSSIGVNFNYFSRSNGLDSSLTSDMEKLDLRYRYYLDPKRPDTSLSFVIQDIHDGNSDYNNGNITDTTAFFEFEWQF